MFPIMKAWYMLAGPRMGKYDSGSMNQSDPNATATARTPVTTALGATPSCTAMVPGPVTMMIMAMIIVIRPQRDVVVSNADQAAVAVSAESVEVGSFTVASPEARSMALMRSPHC
ncbi:hypothetical protein [Microbacterium elymi]|uniref:Uncharacterized protein n=1 Tax=Microbacterium elymi TaxID=2909587 RepID=A0ABY5NK43_9MICO|nr:hypothetical protein [Microbacterium elymi]UUT35540.1 hypothetical protein L2X98_19550 [Microbacterium elymi]